jgi:hypothetical protein
VINNGLDLVLFFSINDVRWRSGIHGAVHRVFLDGGKERGVKHRVYIPGRREAYFKCNWIDNTLHLEGSIAPRS